MKVPADNNGAGVDLSWYAGCGHSFEYLVEPVGIEQRKVPIKDKPIYVLVRDNEKCSPATDTNFVLSRVTESRVKSNYARSVLQDSFLKFRDSQAMYSIDVRVVQFLYNCTAASLHPKRRYRYMHVTCYETFILLVDFAWKLDKSLTLVQWKLDYYSNESRLFYFVAINRRTELRSLLPLCDN